MDEDLLSAAGSVVDEQNNVQCEVDVIELDEGFKVVEVLLSPSEQLSVGDFDELLGKVYADKSDIFGDIYDIVGRRVDTTIKTVDAESVEKIED